MPTQKLAARAAARISRSRQTVRRDGHASRLGGGGSAGVWGGADKASVHEDEGEEAVLVALVLDDLELPAHVAYRREHVDAAALHRGPGALRGQARPVELAGAAVARAHHPGLEKAGQEELPLQLQGGVVELARHGVGALAPAVGATPEKHGSPEAVDQAAGVRGLRRIGRAGAVAAVVVTACL